ncbi:hypothetical protein [Paraburkholderia dinghuensis]|uniref:Uncharacterized protein n=1 Tax=Paraburkholderia dinghuensis TaxID=2305225 RepID=A0A3N6N328_9BURK|nr:hypothetical protein [Paraburkholderia dinghuensis]RQH05001.1 hypothetical protein D1Y85_16460 [Paraburkholderia dinghuensis]
MDLDDLLTHLRRRYADAPTRPRRTRERSSALDAYLADMQVFTLQRLNSDRPAGFTLKHITAVINSKSEHSFSQTAVRKALIAHGLYELWG